MTSVLKALSAQTTEKTNSLADYARRHRKVPLAWAGSTATMDYINIGDALSAVMVALLSGLDVERIPSKSQSLRMGCVGTIGHGFAGGEAWFWGTGASPWENPSAPMPERRRFDVTSEQNFNVTATRGPLSEKLLTGKQEGTVGVYGDPVWLLPHFHAPVVAKKWKLGVIVHLSELADRATETHIREGIARCEIPAEMRDDIHLINTVAPIKVGAIGDKIDEILACERIVSTSLHGLVFAESYGIPCLYFPAHGEPGLSVQSLVGECDLDLRMIDLYRGLGLSELAVYRQPHAARTDWTALIDAIDRSWFAKTCDEEALLRAFPLDLAPLQALPGASIWEHPVLQGLKLQHDVKELRLADKARG